MKYIELTQGQRAMVDDDDFVRLSEFSWTACKAPRLNRTDSWYAYHYFRDQTVTNKQGKAKVCSIAMHRMIMDAPDNRQVDHIDHDPLNNQKLNLRICTPQQNLWNQQWVVTPEKPYKGVRKYRSMTHPGWRAAITCNGREVYLGWFKSAERAARTYDHLAKALFGEFACLNFPEEIAV